MILASSMRLKEYCIIRAIERMAATGLTMPLPAMSGADPAGINIMTGGERM